MQNLSVLLFLTKNKNKGLIAQISTGEGKSTIISMVATYLALCGKSVDIITSTEILAKRDSEEKRPFYKMFKLTS